jgi:phosphatidylethanolamine/phosphatidyl-N-methylethanolamine N-methyltransferase
MNPAGERWLFARKLLERGRGVAAITPSSADLARAMAAPVDPKVPQVVVELGAGTGAVTAAAAARLHPDSRLVAIEIDPDFAALAREAAPRAEVVVGDVAMLRSLLLPLALERVDVVLSGLPFPSLPVTARAAVLGWLAQHPEATFHQLTVMPWVYAGLYRTLFERVTFELVWRNVPPGGVYRCADLRSWGG